MKIANNPRQIYRVPSKAFTAFEDRITKQIIKNKEINHTAFSCELHDLSESFLRKNELACLNKNAKRFAERLIGLGNNSLAGIVYSLLIRINPKNSPIVEQLATNALAIAKRFNDPVHIMARANDLKEIYKITQPGSKKHIKTLYEERRALTKICNEYEKVKLRYCTRKREMKPIESYELKLAAIKFELAEFIALENPKEAIKELNSVLEIMSKFGDGNLTKRCQKLIAELQK